MEVYIASCHTATCSFFAIWALVSWLHVLHWKAWESSRCQLRNLCSFFNSGMQLPVIFELHAQIWHNLLLQITSLLSSSKYSTAVMSHKLLMVVWVLSRTHTLAHTPLVTYPMSASLLCIMYRIMINTDALQSSLSWRGLKIASYVSHSLFHPTSSTNPSDVSCLCKVFWHPKGFWGLFLVGGF